MIILEQNSAISRSGTFHCIHATLEYSTHDQPVQVHKKKPLPIVIVSIEFNNQDESGINSELERRWLLPRLMVITAIAIISSLESTLDHLNGSFQRLRYVRKRRRTITDDNHFKPQDEERAHSTRCTSLTPEVMCQQPITPMTKFTLTST